ncbi:MAG: LAGLIDADG family homing endonuclease [Candidatus Woesearchaeota archaeon]
MNCLSLDTHVMTEHGLKNILDIRVGEKVYAFDQKTHGLVTKKCSGLFNNGIKPVYELKTFHHSIKATSNHPFLTLVSKKRNDPPFIWKNLVNLSKGDEIVVLKKSLAGKKHSFAPIKVSKIGDYKVNKINKVKLPKQSSPDLLEFLGIFVGDGWVREIKAEVGFALPEGTFARKRLVQLNAKLFRANCVTRDKSYVYLYSVNLARFIDSLGFGQGARNKLVPSWLFTVTDQEKESFLKGLMLSDGYLVDNSHRYVSASIRLLKTLRLLLQTMGYRVGKIHQQTKAKGSHVVYRKLLEDSTYGYVCFSKKKGSNIDKWLTQSRNRDYLVDNEFFSTEVVQSVDLVGLEPTLDLRVEGEHNFVADGIVVHNTGIQRSGSTPKYASTTTSPAGKKIHGKTEYSKNMPLIMAAHKAPYVATANIAFPQDFVEKMRKGFAASGPAYVQVFTPCPLGWRFPSNKTIEVAKMAYNTKMTPLFEIANGLLKFSKKPSPAKPIEDYLRMQARFKHMTPEEIKDFQDKLDEEYSKLEKFEECQARF